MESKESLLPCQIVTFIEYLVLEGIPAFLIKCPSCNEENLVLIEGETLRTKRLFCPSCGQKLIYSDKDLASAIKSGLITIGMGYNEDNRDEILMSLGIAVNNLKNYADIYFIALRSERIGHYIGNTFGFMTILNYENKLDRAVIFAFNLKQVSNESFREFLGKYVSFEPWVKDMFAMCIESHDLSHTAVNVTQDYFITDTAHTFIKKPLKIEFSHSERDMAQEKLAKIGIERGKSFICFLGRDNIYTLGANRVNAPNANTVRNMDIRTFLPTMRWFAAQGIYCLRMGNLVQYPLEERNPFIIDFPQHDIHPILDFYAVANCALFIGVSSGPDYLAGLDQIPSLIVNFPHYASIWPQYRTNGYFIYKKYFSLYENRYLSFKQVLDYNFCRPLTEAEYRSELGLRIDSNTPDEILEAAKEVWDRIHHKFITDPQMENLDNMIQKEYRRILYNYFKNSHRLHPNIKDHEIPETPTSIPLTFVLKNQFFLEDTGSIFPRLHKADKK